MRSRVSVRSLGSGAGAAGGAGGGIRLSGDGRWACLLQRALGPGYLVTEDGDYVLDTQSRRIQVNTLLDAKIDENGTIYQNDAAVARIGLTDFEDYDYLEKYGETYYRPIEGARTTQANAQIKSGYLEMSNVQIVSEMVNMIAITRNYESSQKIIQTYDSSLEIAATQLGRI